MAIKINDKMINNIRYADDTILLVSNIDKLQDLVERVQRVSEEYGLHLNISKTKWMIISKSQQAARQLHLDSQIITSVASYIYLGTVVNAIKLRIEKARASFNGPRRLFTCNGFSLRFGSVA